MPPNGWARIAPIIRAFFHREDDGLLHQKRADLEIQRVGVISAKRSTSAKSKYLKSKEVTLANGHAKPLQMSDSAVGVVVPVEGTDIDSRKEGKEGARAPAKPAKRSSAGSRISDDWSPSSDDEEFARSCGLDPTAAAAEFLDYWRGVPGAKALKTDWPATFRNRCRDLGERVGARRELPLLRIAGGRAVQINRADRVLAEFNELVDQMELEKNNGG